MDNRELKELLTALAEGQSADWNALFCEIEPTIKAICTDFFSGADIAEDAAQDVCLMVYRKTALIAASDAPLQYIKRMTHNHCIDLYRRDKKQAALNDTEQIDETVVAEPHGKSDPQTRFVSGISDTVAEMIATLPAAQQEVLRLKYNEDLSIREIAQRLQLPAGTVSSRLYYAHHAIEKKVLHYEKKHRIKLRLKIPFALLPWRRLSQKLLLQSSTVTGSTSAADAAKQSAVAAMAVVTGAAALGTGLTHTDFTPQPQPRTIVQEQDTPDTPDRQATVAAAEGGAAENKTVYQDENILLTHNTTVPRDIVVTDTRYQVAAAPPEEAATEPAAPHTPRFVGEKYNDTLLHDGRLTVEDVVFNMPAEWVENVNVEPVNKIFFSGKRRYCKGYTVYDSELYAYPALQSETYALCKLFVTDCPPENAYYPAENLLGSCEVGGEPAWLYLQPLYSMHPIAYRIPPETLAGAIGGMVDRIEAVHLDLYNKETALAQLNR